MNLPSPLLLTQDFLAKLGQGDVNAVAEAFADDAQWDIPGDQSAFPWIGHKQGNRAAVEFIEQSAQMIERNRLDVHDILANDHRAMVFGELASRVKATGRLIESPFVLILDFDDGKISHFRMIEDSHAVSLAAKADPAA